MLVLMLLLMMVIISWLSSCWSYCCWFHGGHRNFVSPLRRVFVGGEDRLQTAVHRLCISQLQDMHPETAPPELMTLPHPCVLDCCRRLILLWLLWSFAVSHEDFIRGRDRRELELIPPEDGSRRGNGG